MTVAESQYPDRLERYVRYIDDYVNALPYSIDDSVDVLSARLFGLGYRGEDLRCEVWHADMKKIEKRRKR